MMLVAILLPVPLSAATGLSIPLPPSVDRLAAKIVPFADSAPLGGVQGAAGPRGRILETEDERALSKLLSSDSAEVNSDSPAVRSDRPAVSSIAPRARASAPRARARPRPALRKPSTKPPALARRALPKRERKAAKLDSKPPRPPQAAQAKPPQAAQAKPPKVPERKPPKPPRVPKPASDAKKLR